MISLDTNILLPGVESRNADHPRAAAFLESLQLRNDVAICEFILLELYVLLRNPAVLAKPLSSSAFHLTAGLFTTPSGRNSAKVTSPVAVPMIGELRSFSSNKASLTSPRSMKRISAISASSGSGIRLLIAEAADSGFMLWDGLSKGTLNNILNLLQRGKKVVGCFSPSRDCKTLRQIPDLLPLLAQCPQSAMDEFESKLDLASRIAPVLEPENCRAPARGGAFGQGAWGIQVKALPC